MSITFNENNEYLKDFNEKIDWGIVIENKITREKRNNNIKWIIALLTGFILGIIIDKLNK